MSATSTPSIPLTTSSPEWSPTGVAARTTASVRTRYRRQTAALMVGTTFVGLWFGLTSPSVSPVAPSPWTVALPADELTAPSIPFARRQVAEAGRRGRDDGRRQRR